MIRKLTIELSNAGETERININYVNPNATQQQMEDAVTAIAALSADSYVGTTVTETYEL